MKNFHFNPFRSHPPSCCRLLNSMYHRKGDEKTHSFMFLPHVTISTSQVQPIVSASSCQSIFSVCRGTLERPSLSATSDSGSDWFFHISVEKNDSTQQLDTLQRPFQLDFKVLTSQCLCVTSSFFWWKFG